MKKIIYEDKYGHGELKEGHTYKVKDGRVIEIDKDKMKWYKDGQLVNSDENYTTDLS